MPLRGRHLLGIEDLDLDEIELILNTSRSFKEISTRSIKKVPTLRGKSLINLFYEPSVLFCGPGPDLCHRMPRPSS